MGNLLKSLLTLGLMVACGHSLKAVTTGPVIPYPDTEKFNLQALPIYKSRIVRIPESKQIDALKLLSGKQFCAASPQIIEQLLGDQKLDTRRMLDEQVAAALNYAKERKEESANPFFGDARVWMRAQAEAHEEFANYTKKLSADLRPYLVETKVYSEGTGAYEAVLKGRVLHVTHGSLGGPPSPTTIVVMIFLEREIERVVIKAGTAE